MNGTTLRNDLEEDNVDFEPDTDAQYGSRVTTEAQSPHINTFKRNSNVKQPFIKKNTNKAPENNKKKKHNLVTTVKSKEKSCSMLLSIVLLFTLTQSFRLAIKIYEVSIPNSNTSENFDRCSMIGR